jgi:WD40 repeat protein
VIAEIVQRSLHRLAKPWWKLRAMHVFRDESDLAASPRLWPSIESALERSRWLILIASRSAAASKWVRREIECWLARGTAQQIVIVLTDGVIEWSEAQHDFDWTTTTALPDCLRGKITNEPRWVDLRSIDAASRTLASPSFRQAMVDVASTVRGVPKDQLDSEDRTALRRTRRVIGFSLVILASLVAATVGLFQRSERVGREKEVEANNARAARAGAFFEEARQHLVNGRRELAQEAIRKAADSGAAGNSYLTLAREATPLAPWMSIEGYDIYVEFSPEDAQKVVLTEAGRGSGNRETWRLLPDKLVFEEAEFLEHEPGSYRNDHTFILPAEGSPCSWTCNGARCRVAPAGSDRWMNISRHQIEEAALACSPMGSYVAARRGNEVTLFAAADQLRISDDAGAERQASAVSRLVLPRARAFDLHQLAMRFSPDEDYLLTGWKPSQLWVAPTGRLLATIPLTGLYPEDGLFSGDGRWLIMAGAEHIGGGVSSVTIFRLPPTRVIARRAATAATFSPTSKWTAVADADGVRLQFANAHPSVVLIAEPWAKNAQRLTVSADGNILAIVSADGRAAHFWDVSAGKEIGSFGGGRYRITPSLAMTRDGKRAVLMSGDEVVLLRTAGGRVDAREYVGSTGADGGACFSADERLIHAFSSDVTLGTGEVHRAVESARSIAVSQLTFGNGTELPLQNADEIGTTVNGQGCILDVDVGANRTSIIDLRTPDTPIVLIGQLDDAIVNAPEKVAFGWRGSVAGLWDLTTGNQLISLEGHKAPIVGGALAPDVSTAFTWDNAGTMIQWEIAPREMPVERVRAAVHHRQMGHSPPAP